jgi:CRISPR/Cas system endoribonuclease Cas6 (RAMP superfamily)
LTLIDRVRSLGISPFRVHLAALSEFFLPEYKGSVFRGGFGRFFRDLVCVTRAPVCEGCSHLATCAYSVVFETPVHSPQATVLRKYPFAPHPFVLTPPLEKKERIAQGSELFLDLVLFGRGVNYLPHFIQALEAMGTEGGRRHFHVKRITSGLNPEAIIYDGAKRRLGERPEIWSPEDERARVRRIHLHFLTPLRLRTEGKYNRSPDFIAIAQALLHRLHLVTTIHGGCPADREWMRIPMAQADRVACEAAEFRLYDWSRKSARQGRSVPMSGVVGRLVGEGDLTDLATAFRAGEFLHIGSGTSMGLGKYRAIYEC